MTGHVWLVLASGFLFGAVGQGAAEKDYGRFEGIWRFDLVEVEGAKRPPVPFETNKIIIGKDGNFIVVHAPKITRGVFKLDPSKSPRHFDFIVSSGSAKGQTITGIYEISDDTYKLCLPLPEKARPADFVSKPGSGTILQILKRERQDVKEALTKVGRQELTGSWQAVSYALDGNKASDEDMKHIKLVFDAAGNGVASREGKVFVEASSKLDLSKNPPAIDFHYTTGDYKGQTSLGIYEVEDDVLTICRAPNGKARPTKFESTPGSGLTLMGYKRDKVVADK
ncbi:MAG TPA: TIGR03067 domain-containing protein [Gemmataceae bacterium]|nr:TIGR03067 domain-containing protein [Gemmataceae bacterium]